MGSDLGHAPRGGEYQPRKPRASALFRCADRHAHELRSEGKFQRFLEARVIERFLECGDPHYGFARIYCPGCRHDYLLAFSCKARYFCPSCHQKRVLAYGDWVEENVLAPVPHRQYVFTVPKILRPVFSRRRALLASLCHIAERLLLDAYHVAAPEGRPGLIFFVQTFGDLVTFNPHIHVLAADGVFRADGAFIGLSAIPVKLSAPTPSRAAQERADATPPPSFVTQAPAPSVPQFGGDREGRFGDIWRMIRASAQRSDDDVRRAQADIEARPKPEHTNRKEARKLNQLGLDAYRARQIDEAVVRFFEAHRNDPRDQEISGNLGLALLDAGKLAEAEVALMEALQIEPARVGAWTVLGMVIAQRGDQAAALGALLNAYRYSKDQAKTLGYFTQLAESDLREPVRLVASEALRRAGQ